MSVVFSVQDPSFSVEIPSVFEIPPYRIILLLARLLQTQNRRFSALRIFIFHHRMASFLNVKTDLDTIVTILLCLTPRLVSNLSRAKATCGSV